MSFVSVLEDISWSTLEYLKQKASFRKVPPRLVWRSKVPPRVAFFSWSTSLGKILTTNNLCKRHIIVLDWRYMCKRCGESVDHLLHCPIAYELQSLVLCLFGLQGVMPLKVMELFESWQGKFKWHCNIDLQRLLPHCLMWCIWSERNARCFERCEWSSLKIKSFFLHTLLDWSIALLHFSCFPSLFCLIIVILVFDFCPHGTSPIYSGWLFLY